ncbi:PepSY-associated TM helix domain-containing protein [Sphingomonas sp. RB3P16]|uniref:PepSY-associated TM helix domain-containing protein n=1 Tax=Parasphingomonas frigoris TaxID=3096163 RepID=UPI002FC77E36
MSKIKMRNAWFQVHKWIGLLLAVLIIPLSVTGAALVWDDALDHALNPQRYATSGGASVAPERYVAAVRAALAPGERITALTLPDSPVEPVVVTATSAAKPKRTPGPPARKTVWLDPASARVLDTAGSGGGLLRTFHMIHGSLLIPGVGRQVVGWIGVAMLLSCVSGLWLWWPTVGRWVRGLRWRRHRNTDTNLHHLFGFWIALPLFVLSLTGAWISFPKVFGGGPPGGRPGGARPVPLATPQLPVDGVIDRADGVLAGSVARIEWPTDQKPAWRVSFVDEPRSVVIDDASGVAKVVPPAPESLARTMRRIHDGTQMGLVWQIVIFLGGLLPAILAVTGIIMWWRSRGWRAQVTARQRERETVGVR